MRLPNPVQKFAVLSSVCIAGLCFALALAISYLLEHHMRDVEWLSTAEIVKYEVDENDLARYLTDPQLRLEPPRYREAFKRLLDLPEVVRIKIWDREATVLWSDDERLIGKRFPENAEVKQALAGQVSVALKTLQKKEQEYERERFTVLAEVYVPIASKTSGEIMGIVEVYKLPARLFAGIRRMQSIVWGIAILGGILLYVVLLPIVRRSYREQLKLEGSLREHARHLEEANRAKSQFLANMSHELRTPLNAIIGFSALLMEGLHGPLTEKQRRHLGHIHTSGQHLLAIINDILDLSKVEAGKLELTLEPVDLGQVIRDSLAPVRGQAAAKGLRLESEVPEGLPPAVADPLRLKQILYNLLSNAVKFTPEGGAVTVGAEREAEVVAVWVRDTGVGIAPEDQERIFREFEQADNTNARQHQGTGLGLALTRMLVELHGGKIWVESALGQGSTFTLTLPQGAPADAPALHA